jgi:hypothetical protein
MNPQCGKAAIQHKHSCSRNSELHRPARIAAARTPPWLASGLGVPGHFLQSHGHNLRRQPYAPQQIFELRVGTQRIKDRVRNGELARIWKSEKFD